MTSIKQALTNVEALAKQYRSVLEIADILREIDNLDERTRNAKDAAGKARKMRDAEEKDLAEVEGRVKVAEEELQALLDRQAQALAETELKLKEEKERAEAERDKLISDGRKTAADLITDAKRKVSVLQEQVTVLEQEKESLAKEVSDMRAERDAFLKKFA